MDKKRNRNIEEAKFQKGLKIQALTNYLKNKRVLGSDSQETVRTIISELTEQYEALENGDDRFLELDENEN